MNEILKFDTYVVFDRLFVVHSHILWFFVKLATKKSEAVRRPLALSQVFFFSGISSFSSIFPFLGGDMKDDIYLEWNRTAHNKARWPTNRQSASY